MSNSSRLKTQSASNTKKKSGILSSGLLAAAMAVAPVSVFSTVFATLAVSNSAMATTPADNLTAAKRLNALLTNTKSMTANFTQTTKGAENGTIARNGTFSGSMQVERPNKFRWSIQSPSEQLIVANNDTLWVYDKDLEQATKQNAATQMGSTPALLLSGNPNKIADNFKITQPNNNKNYYVLYPKDSNANFKSLSVSFSGGKPVMMVLNDSLGQVTSIKFSNVKLNTNIADSQFKFTPPKGVDVIAQ